MQMNRILDCSKSVTSTTNQRWTFLLQLHQVTYLAAVRAIRLCRKAADSMQYCQSFCYLNRRPSPIHQKLYLAHELKKATVSNVVCELKKGQSDEF